MASDNHRWPSPPTANCRRQFNPGWRVPILGPVAPDWITLFEAAANRRLRVRQQEISTTLTPVSGSVSLPSDYLSWRRVTWSGSPLQELEYVTPTYANWAFPGRNTPSNPAVFTIEGSTLKVRPSSDTALNFDYFQKIPALSLAAPIGC